MPATSIQRLKYRLCPLTRVMVTKPSSNGWRSASSVGR